MTPITKMLTCGLACFGLTCVTAQADLISNGGFEAGFTGWTVVNEAGSFSGSNWFIQSGTASPIGGFAVPAPPGPTHAAMTDQGGPGSHALLQTFTVPGKASSVVLSFDMFRGNRAGAWAAPNSLDFNTVPNQQARVDILTASAGAFDLGSSVVDNLFTTLPGSTLVDSTYLHYMFDLTSVVGAGTGTFQLRFAETDNQLFLNLGVDNVSIAFTPLNGVPEPSTGILFLTLIGPAGLIARFRPRSQNKTQK